MALTEAAPVRAQGSSTTLKQEFTAFSRHFNPRFMVGALAIALALRVVLGGWTWWDLVIVGGLIAAEPFVEWMIHVFVLHWKPKQVFGRNWDPYISRKHRAHHSDPKKVEWIFVPEPVVIRLISGAAILYLLVFPTLRYALTGLVTGTTILLVYEWTHYLIHSRYIPRSRIYRYIWRAHRLHHFKNEKYWFGVTMHAADHILGTFPAKEDVETSPTCKTLGIEATI